MIFTILLLSIIHSASIHSASIKAMLSIKCYLRGPDKQGPNVLFELADVENPA